MSNANSQPTFNVEDEVSNGIRLLGERRFEAAYTHFYQVIDELKRRQAGDASVSQDLAAAYDYAERSAYGQARGSDVSDSREWLLRALTAGECSAAIREQLLRASPNPHFELRGRMLTQLQVLSLEHMGLGNFDKALELARRSAKFQEDRQEHGTVPMFYLSACGNEAMVLFRQKRLDDALRAVNKALHSFDPESLDDADGLKCYAKLCEMKATIIGARNAKKLN
ncbi:MAG: hypothetical protein K2X77_33045 [Candidatus Obscuribacterales bacterium]|nr:hypothetical protein [Candidatus Obscuribacterales bacterium]